MLRAGYAAVDITPPPENSLIGYEFRQQNLPAGNAGVHDPLSARVLVLGTGGPEDRAAALVTLDLCVLTTAMARRVRAAAAEAVGLAPERVVVACSHTHSGPFPQHADDVGDEGKFLTPFAGGAADAHPDHAYAERLLERVAEASASAGGLLLPVEAGVQQAPLGIAYNRRVPADDGVGHCWNPQEWPDLSPAPAIDPTLTVLALRQPDGPRRYVLWSLGAHAVVLGKTSRVVSADWPGAANRLIETSLPGARPLFVQGASGDSHPWIATQEDPAHAAAVAAPAAGLVTLLAQATRGAAGEDPLATAARTVTLSGCELDLAVWRVGPAYLAVVPVELFQALGAAVRGRVPGPLLLATCANGWSGYCPTREAFDVGGYEVEGARRLGRRPGDGERLVDEVASLAERVC